MACITCHTLHLNGKHPSKIISKQIGENDNTNMLFPQFYYLQCPYIGNCNDVILHIMSLQLPMQGHNHCKGMVCNMQYYSHNIIHLQNEQNSHNLNNEN